jgi:hypothetical protein
LSGKTDRALDKLARQRRQTRSDIVREAIEAYAASKGGAVSGDGPFDRWVDVIGVVRLGAREPARTTGEQFTGIVREKHARRSR